MAFYCNHMSLHLVQSNEDFIIYGPVIMNAEVIAYKEDIENMKRVGIGHKREHLHKLAKETYKQIKAVIELSSLTLPYSLEGGQIDGAVLDLTKAQLLPGFKFIPLSEEDYISYSLVVRKDLIETVVFEEFLESYNKTVEEFNKVDELKKYICISEEYWDHIKIKFLSLE